MAGPESGVGGIVLAGGLARRMGGGDKGLLELAGRPILDHVLARLAPQVRFVALNVNGDASRFARWGLPTAPDTLPGNHGPLAGILAGLDWMVANAPGLSWVATVPTDAPFLPRNLVARMLAKVEASGAEMACAVSGGRRHPVAGLWPIRLRNDLRHALIEDGVRKIDAWTARYRLVETDFGGATPDPFFNVNEEADLERARRALADSGPAG